MINTTNARQQNGAELYVVQSEIVQIKIQQWNTQMR